MGIRYTIQLLPEPIEVEAESESHAVYYALKNLEDKIKNNLPRKSTHQILNIEEENIEEKQMELTFG